MGDFFYYGQKDTIRRLNELAGRGAVVASYAPAVGRSPLGGPNGYMNPAWIDPNISLISGVSAGFGAANKYGYNYLKSGGTHSFYKLATLEQNSLSSFSSLRIDAMVGEWAAETLTPMTIVIGSRDATGSVKVEWSSSRGLSSAVKFLAYKESNGQFSVYLYFSPGVYAQASLQMMCMGATTYATPVETTSVTGVITWDSGAAPGNAGYMPSRMQGMHPAAGTSFVEVVEARTKDGISTAISYLASGTAQNILSAGQEHEVLRLGIGGISGTAFSGGFGFMTTSGNGSAYKDGFSLSVKAYDQGSNAWTSNLFSIKGNGTVYMPWLKAGTVNAATRHDIRKLGVQGTEIFQVGREGSAAPCLAVNGSDGLGGWAGSASVLYVGKNATTSRGIASPGTFNAQGTDYAEYFVKFQTCAAVIAGQIVGVNNKNQVTDLWADAVMFAIKSTDPSFVGGDSWANGVGPRPSPQAGPAPTQPLRRADALTQQAVPGTNPPEFEDVVTESGDTDEEWAEKQAAYTAALAAHNIAVQQDAEAMDTFDAALEVERQKVDRIAIAGRVPVNVQGAQPGDYIVPVQDGAGIKGIAVHEDDISMKQYFRAVGRVISIEPDGRAYVMVKVV